MTFINRNNLMPRDGTLVANKVNPNAGRFGDTFVRPVHGVDSHVNALEARVIDNLGPLGQAMVKNTRPPGTETINPETGAPEYFAAPWGQLLTTGLSLGLNAWGGPSGVSDDELAGKMSNWKGQLDKLENRADGMMDPNSPYNQNMIKDMEKRNYDQLAFSEMMGSRGAAQGGVGGYSGIQGAQAQANMDKTQALNTQMTEQMLQSNLKQGLGLQSSLADQFAKYDQPFAQKAIDESAAKQLDFSQAVSGMGSGLMGSLLMQDQQKAGYPGDMGGTFIKQVSEKFNALSEDEQTSFLQRIFGND